MAIVHTTVTLEHKSGQPRDRVVNTFTFSSVGVIGDFGFLDVNVALDHFYNDVAAGAASSVSSLISGAMSRTIKPIIRHYDVTGHLAGDPAGSPIAEYDMPNVLDANSGATPLPSEVAICLTAAADFNADVEFGPGTRPRARDRSRLYIGPLHASVLDVGAANQPVPSPGAIDTLRFAGAALRDDANTTWCVWSRAGQTVKPITNVWVDNAFDTQRRRGERATARLVA